jgi:hypothetical protein
MRRDQVIKMVWAIGGLIALVPAMCLIFLGILTTLAFLPTLPKAKTRYRQFSSVVEVIGHNAN